MDLIYPLVPIANFLGFILALIPLFAVTRVRNAANIAIISFAVWISVACFIHGVNTVLWKDNVNDFAPIWCDISESCLYAVQYKN